MQISGSGFRVLPGTQVGGGAFVLPGVHGAGAGTFSLASAN